MEAAGLAGRLRACRVRVKARHLRQVTVTRSSSAGSGGFRDKPGIRNGRRPAGVHLAPYPTSHVTADQKFSASCAARPHSLPVPPTMLPCPRSGR
jgi:hypothetical protein